MRKENGVRKKIEIKKQRKKKFNRRHGKEGDKRKMAECVRRWSEKMRPDVKGKRD